MRNLLILAIALVALVLVYQQLLLPPRAASPEVDELIQMLSGDSESRKEARERLIELGAEAVPALIEATRDPNPWVRWEAVNALGYIGDPRAIPALVERILKDDNPHPRWRSIWAVQAVDREGTEAVPLLLKGLKSDDEVVVWNAAVGLSAYKRPEAVPILMEGLGSEDEFRQWEAIFCLSNVWNEETVPALIPILKGGRLRARQEAANTLGAIGDKRAVPALLEALENDESPEVRWRAAVALGRIGDPSVIPKLEELLQKEEDEQVIEHIQEALELLREEAAQE